MSRIDISGGEHIKMHDEYYRLLGLRISFIRKTRKLSQIELAEKVNISRTFMSKIEAPNIPTPFSLEVVFRIAEALDVKVSELFDF